MRRAHCLPLEGERSRGPSMALQAAAKSGLRPGFCSRNQRKARTSDRMCSESPSGGVSVVLAQEIRFVKQETGSHSSSEQAKTDMFLATDLGPQRSFLRRWHDHRSCGGVASVCDWQYERHRNTERALIRAHVSGRSAAIWFAHTSSFFSCDGQREHGAAMLELPPDRLTVTSSQLESSNGSAGSEKVAWSLT